jgi:hypothetical protein
MKIRAVAAAIGVTAVWLTVLLSAQVSPTAQAHDSEDSPATTQVLPGASSQLPGGPSVPAAQLGSAAAATRPTGSPTSFAPATKAIAAPSCTPTVFVLQCESLP